MSSNRVVGLVAMRRRALAVVAGFCVATGGVVSAATPAAAATHIVPVPQAQTSHSAGMFGPRYVVQVAPNTTLIRVVRPTGIPLGNKPGRFSVDGDDWGLIDGPVPSGAPVVEVPTTPATWQQRPDQYTCEELGEGAACFVIRENALRASDWNPEVWQSRTTLLLVRDASMPTVTIDFSAGAPGSAFVSSDSYVTFGEPFSSRTGAKKALKASWGDRIVFVGPTAGYWTTGPTGTAAPAKVKVKAVIYAAWDQCPRSSRSRPGGYSPCKERRVTATTAVSGDGTRLTVTLPKQRRWAVGDPTWENLQVSWQSSNGTAIHTSSLTRFLTLL